MLMSVMGIRGVGLLLRMSTVLCETQIDRPKRERRSMVVRCLNADLVNHSSALDHSNIACVSYLSIEKMAIASGKKRGRMRKKCRRRVI